MRFALWLALLPTLASAAPKHQIVGTWLGKKPDVRVTMVFGRNGDYNSINDQGKAKLSFVGKYELTGNNLRLRILTAVSVKNGKKLVTHLDRTGDATVTWKDNNHIVVGISGGGASTAFTRQ